MWNLKIKETSEHNKKEKKKLRGTENKPVVTSGESGEWGFPSGSAVKNPPVMQELQEMWVQSLGQEDPLEEGMATHSSILAWEIPWTEEPGRLQSMGLQKSWT